MENRNRFVQLLLVFATIVFTASLLAACQNIDLSVIEPSSTISSATPIPSSTATRTPTPTDTHISGDTPVPSETPVPTDTPPATQEIDLEASENYLERLMNPCKFKLQPIDPQYSNPQENLDPQTGTTWMAITVEEGILTDEDSFHYWWDTRAFSGDLSFNVGDGPCQVLLDTQQILCEGIPLKSTDNLPTGGYEYDFKLYIQNEACNSELNYQQRGLIFMNTQEHDVFQVNGEDVP